MVFAGVCGSFDSADSVWVYFFAADAGGRWARNDEYWAESGALATAGG